MPVPDLDEEPVELLYAACGGVELLPLPRGGDDLQLLARRKLLLELLVHLNKKLSLRKLSRK